MVKPARGLGRGLDSLFGSAEAEFDKAQEKGRKEKTEPTDTAQSGGDTAAIAISKVSPDPDQPRKHFDAEAIEELAASIRVHGVLQPILVTQKGAKYTIIAGERRWRAAQLAGLTEIPAVVYTGTQAKEAALIENLQREDLNAIEAANAISRLMAEHKLTQESVAGRIGKSRPYITNLLRLLELHPDVQQMIAEDRLSAGHAKALAAVKDRAAQLKLAQAAADGKMSVRDAEKAARQFGKPATAGKSAPAAFSQSLELKELKNLMQRVFGTKVEIFGNDEKGRIYIDYFSRDDIDRIAEIIQNLN